MALGHCLFAFSPLFGSHRGEGVDGVGARRPGSRDGSGLRAEPAARHQVQLQRHGRAAPRHRVGLGAVPAGSGLQLQEVPPLQHQRCRFTPAAVIFYTSVFDVGDASVRLFEVRTLVLEVGGGRREVGGASRTAGLSRRHSATFFYLV